MDGTITVADIHAGKVRVEAVEKEMERLGKKLPGR